MSVVDHDRSTREALELLISSAGLSARTYAYAHQFLAAPRVLSPGCLIAEVTLPDLHGLELQQRIANRYEMPIIFITCQTDIPTTVRAMKAGALEFMLKPFGADAMLHAIAIAIEHSRNALIRETELRFLRECHASLTRRERQVMALVVQGIRNKMIGAQLGIREITVKTHRGNVMRKMMVRSVPELVTVGARLGLGPRASDDPYTLRQSVTSLARFANRPHHALT